MRERYTRVSIPERCHPLVRRLFIEMQKQRIGVLDMAERAGVNKNTLRDWRTSTIPRVADLEACFNVLGLSIQVRKLRSTPDPATRNIGGER